MSLQIAAAPFLVQLFFQTKAGNGFSESYWVNGDSYESTLSLVTAADGLVKKRRQMFTAEHYISYVRVSDSTKKRDTLVAAYTIADGLGEYSPDAEDTQADEVALLARVKGHTEDTTPYFALRPFRLLPEECVTNSSYVPTDAFTDAFNDLSDWMQLHGKLVVKVLGEPAALDIDGMVAMHTTRRKVGRPFAASRGRSLRP